MSQSSHPLVGTWKLVEWRYQDSLGVWQESFGAKPLGYFVYGEGGYLSIHLMHEDGADVEGCDPSLATRFAAEDLLVLTECYAGYFGRYRIEPGDSRTWVICEVAPSASIHRTKICEPVGSPSVTYAMRVPSGDHRGLDPLVRNLFLEPSALMIHSSESHRSSSLFTRLRP